MNFMTYRKLMCCEIDHIFPHADEGSNKETEVIFFNHKSLRNSILVYYKNN